MAKASPRRTGRKTSSPLSGVADRLAAFGELVEFVYRRKVWWLLPLILALIILSVLLLLEATPLGPLIYPVF